MTDSINEVVKKLIETGMVSPNEIIGCSELELQNIEKIAPGPLPNSYKSFLKHMGKGAGSLFEGSDIYYPELLECKDAASRLLKHSVFPLPDTAFVFYQHQDYLFMYFLTDSGDDPSVYRFTEGDRQPALVDNQFSNWLERSVADECKLFSENKAIKAELGL